MQLLKLHGNRNSAEEITELPLTQTSPYDFKILFKETVTDICEGDLFRVDCDFELTTPYVFNVMAASVIRATETPNIPWSGYEVSEANGQNFNRSEHHYVRTRFGWWEAPRDFTTLTFTLVVYAASNASAPGDKLKVEQDYGRFCVAQYRN